MEDYDKIKKELLNLKLMVQKVQIKRYVGVESISLSAENKIAAEIQAILRSMGTLWPKLNQEDKKRLVPVREALLKMQKKDAVAFSTIYALAEKL